MSCQRHDVVLVDSPRVSVIHLHASGPVKFVGKHISCPCRVEFSVVEFGKPEVVIFRSSQVERLHKSQQGGVHHLVACSEITRARPVVPVDEVGCEQAAIGPLRARLGVNILAFNMGIVYVEAQFVCIAYFSVLYIQFDNAETRRQVGIFSAYINAVYRLVFGYRGIHVVGNVLHVSVGRQQVDVVVVVHDNQFSCRLAPCNVRNVAVA